MYVCSSSICKIYGDKIYGLWLRQSPQKREICHFILSLMAADGFYVNFCLAQNLLHCWVAIEKEKKQCGK